MEFTEAESLLPVLAFTFFRFVVRAFLLLMMFVCLLFLVLCLLFAVVASLLFCLMVV